MITIGYSTRNSNPIYSEVLKHTCGLKNVEVIEIVNDGIMSLSQAYNKILEQSSNDIVVLCHDDLEFDTNNWGNKLLKHFSKNSDYGIIGMAGTKYLPITGRWWDIPHTMYGIVNHKQENKKWTSTYSKDIGNKVEEVTLIDGLFISLDKRRIKHNFDESFNGFHFYDLAFCVPNFLSGVKIGVITDIRLTHLSVGMTNEVWEQNRIKFSEKYKQHLPLDITNQNKCESFIFCHDQDIILDYESHNKFGSLKNYRYVFLGNREIDKIENNDKVIIARNLKHNIEEFPNINSYTGWYALWKNDLIKTPYVNLFEYDIIINDKLEQVISKFIYDNHKMIGYIPISCRNSNFIDDKRWVNDIFVAIKDVYKIDLEKTIRMYITNNPNMSWSSTSNATFEISFFKQYMSWFEPLAEKLKPSITAGHGHERSTTFFCLLNKYNPIILQGLMVHYQMNSHGTQEHIVDFDSKIKELIENNGNYR